MARTTVGSALVASALALGAAACGGGSDPAPYGATPTPVSTPGPTPTVAPPATPPPTPAPTPPPPREPTLDDLRLTLVASGLEAPLFLTAPPGEPDRLLVVEQPGRIREIGPGGVLEEPFLDVSERVRFGGELGLLGLAFHPAFESNGLFYVNYVDRDLVSVTSEFSVDVDDPRRGDPASERRLLEVRQDSTNHHGGMLAFGPDGALHLSLGDSAQGGDPLGHAQDGADPRGKILRFDPFAFPAPLANAGLEDPHVLHLGLRNPWRFSFDRATGDLYVADVGEVEAEEVNVVPSGAVGVNFGWNVAEGPMCFRPPWTEDPRPECDASGFQPPTWSYGRDGGCSVIGGYVYRGPSAPPLVGRYVFSDYCSNRVFSFVWRDGEATGFAELTDALRSREILHGPTSFGEDGHGNLYVLDIRGAVHRIEVPL